jgi:hypothetical protein
MILILKMNKGSKSKFGSQTKRIRTTNGIIGRSAYLPLTANYDINIDRMAAISISSL